MSPRLQTTTLWHSHSQQHGDQRVYGNPRYTGRTPSYVIWNLLERYTRAGDTVLDPFCGGGTTLDVADELGRKGLGFDVAPSREDIAKGDARDLPLDPASVDFVFMDPPYSTHIEYSDAPECIGRLDAFEDEYFDAMAVCFDEARRVLKDRRYLAVYVSDTFKKGRGFVGIGARMFTMLERRFKPIDHISVARGNRKLDKPNFHRAAAEQNFFLRGFNHLLIFKKEQAPRR